MVLMHDGASARSPTAKASVSALARWRSCAAILAVAVSLGCAASGPPTASSAPAEAVVGSYYSAIGSGAYADAADLVRLADGSPLAPTERAQLIAEWEAAYGPRGGMVHVTSVRLVATKPQPTLPGSRNVAEERLLTVDVDGTSETRCLPLPLRSVAVLALRIDDRWFIGQDEFTVHPHCRA